jgi:hypothetical protein
LAKKAVGVALFGVSERFAKCGGDDEAMRLNLVDNTFRYCGIRDGKPLSYFDTMSNKRKVT